MTCQLIVVYHASKLNIYLLTGCEKFDCCCLETSKSFNPLSFLFSLSAWALCFFSLFNVKIESCLCNCFSSLLYSQLLFLSDLFHPLCLLFIFLLSITLFCRPPPPKYSAFTHKCQKMWMWWRLPFRQYTYTFSLLAGWPPVSASVPREPEEGGRAGEGCSRMWCDGKWQGN